MIQTPKKGGGSSGRKNNDPPIGPTQIRRERMEKEDPIPKLNHLLTGVDNFARWYQGLKLYLDMKDFDDYGEYSYWDIISGKLIEWDEGAITENDSISYRKWRKANAFILLTIRKNSEEGPFRLVGLCDTGAEVLKILKTHYENKSEADLGIALTKVTTMTFKEDIQGGIGAHIEEFEKRWEKMTTIASGSLKPAYLEAGRILQKMGRVRGILLRHGKTLQFNRTTNRDAIWLLPGEKLQNLPVQLVKLVQDLLLSVLLYQRC